MKCSDCGASTISPAWTRCYDCAYRRAQKIMAGESPEPAKQTKRVVFIRGNRVMVRGKGPGTVRHRKQPRLSKLPVAEYAVELDGGSRVHVPAIELTIIDERPEAPHVEVRTDRDPPVGSGDDGSLSVLPDGVGEPHRCP